MKSNRIESLDLLRGLVMIIMALDHVRDYFHADAFLFDPTDVNQTNLPLFFTRFVTHYCAPVFIFLAGTSAFLVGQRKSKGELATWLLKRGIWLIIAEFTIIKFGWFFKLDFGYFTLMVIWVLGLSMICLAGIIYLPRIWVIAVSVLGILGHNFLDGLSFQSEPLAVVWSFLHQFRFNQIGDVTVVLVYPLIPWVLVMSLGYHFGALYTSDFPAEKRKKLLKQLGAGLIILFVGIRFCNLFGDPVPFVTYDTFSKTIISFLSVSKYPPSALYLFITLGPALLFLAYTEGWKGKFANAITVIGRVPMFYYILHIYFIHLGALGLALATGYTVDDMIIDVFVNFEEGLKGYGVNLGWTYLVWIVLVIGMYPICKWYDQYKQNHRDRWWLTYL